MNGAPNSKFQEKLEWIEFHVKLFYLFLTHSCFMNFWSCKPQGKQNKAKLQFGAMWKTHFFSSSSCYSIHDYNFEYVCLCFLLYFVVARKLVMFVPPHIAHKGGLSSVSFWLHHCKLWKEEEEVVVHNSQPLLFTLFWWLLHRRWQQQKEECPSFGLFCHFIIVDDDNKRRMFKLIFWFCFLVISCSWWWHKEEHGAPSHIFLFRHLYMDRKTNVTSFLLARQNGYQLQKKKQSKGWLQIQEWF